MEYRFTDAEAKFADLIWLKEPIASGELVKLCEQEFDWKKSTTYTMLKRLEGKQIFANDNGTVSSLITKEDFYAGQSKQFVEDAFDGSLPKFLAAFTRSKKISDQEIDELQKLIDQHKEE
ncbi:BlaI/MecI/CopY family transcriptional regulator [Desulfuribacillus alkaliarsenatis]|uniref:BlaI/MecI/CopY family transcriptional regulator n=1 Tax=Desulfuribacillus alkaliarsenatis TaxID=766136 RepID=A0A1E5G2T8_9FIRM|nr:BlaI/MecI/CopY family transcriptional regulator [Desulfuribacillus alkaliarsenatis]OEF97363.1 BlaI/MecI/CopY family transcriptional regulator [Desulfuribacillus alkaliarsenatis]